MGTKSGTVSIKIRRRNNMDLKTATNIVSVMIEATCIECGDKFNGYTGDMDERTCLTCILKDEDPEVIKE